MFEVAQHGLALVDEQRHYLHLNEVGSRILGVPAEELLGSDLLTNLAAEERTAAAAWFESSIGGAPRKEDFEISLPGGSRRVASFFCVPVRLGDSAAALAAFHDVTRVRRAEYEAGALNRIASRLAQESTVNAISSRLAEQVVSVTPAVASAVILLGGDPLRGRVAGSWGLSSGFSEALEATLLVDPQKLTERMPRPGEAQLIPGLQELYRNDRSREHFHSYLDEVTWDSLVCVALTYLGERTGALFSYFPDGYAASEADVAFLQAIANQSVFAIENARLLAAVQDKAALEERQRLARELHDSVSQALYGISLGTRSARSLLDRQPERVGERLDYVMKMAEAAISEMRALIFELRPETLETEGLALALAKQASAMHSRHGLEVHTEIGDEPALTFVEKQALYRIAQEALHNVVKHARAQRVSLELGRTPGRVVLEIRDDGVGFDTRASFPGHIGLESMRERAEGLGGSFSLSSTPGEGTTLRVELPTGN